MVFSKVFCSTYAGPRVAAEQSSFIALNPVREAGSVLFAGSCAERAAIGGQVAAKLSLQHFASGAEESLRKASSRLLPTEICLAAIEAAFRTANSAVYEFGHKLSAGGRMAASLISVFVRDGVIAAGRVGRGVAYLARQGEVFPFFAAPKPVSEFAYVGSNSLVAVELASVPAQAGDVILIFSETGSGFSEEELGYSVSLLLPRFDQIDYNSEGGSAVPFRNPGAPAFDNSASERIAQQIFREKSPAFSAVLAIGPEVSFLGKELRAPADRESYERAPLE